MRRLSRYSLDQPANWPRCCSNSYACSPLTPVQPLCICKTLQEFHHNHLKNNRYSNDSYEQLVPVYSLKYVLLFKFPCVEFIEYLAKNKASREQLSDTRPEPEGFST